ncbi:hypothetical protein [Nesterenkonia muleiensis]|uniref:hypothetical protein n=1 Tax=Nesterenkonia muleiensis TaxID=2282648 RepID=UPI000E749F49|nr:hypothetical protein [Nesterenkonia muleiensis]
MVGTGWRRVLTGTTAAGLVALGLASGAAAVLHGWQAAASAAAGGGVIIALSFVTLAVIDWADRHMPHQILMLAIAAYALKLTAAAMVFVSVPVPDWVRPGWAGLTALGVLIVWQVALVLTFMRLRVPIFSPPAVDES